MMCPECEERLVDVDIVDEGDSIIKVFYCQVCDKDYERLYEDSGWV